MGEATTRRFWRREDLAVQFLPGLDRRAKTLTLLCQEGTERAVIILRLPHRLGVEAKVG